MDKEDFELHINKIKQKPTNGNNYSLEQYVIDILHEVYNRGYDEGFIDGSRDAMQKCY